jgi:hypothetical protein
MRETTLRQWEALISLFERNNLNYENNLILFPQNLKKTPSHSTFKNIFTLEYVLSSPTEAVPGLGQKKQ